MSFFCCLKSILSFQIAKGLKDDQCGEKLALLEDVIEYKETPENIKSQYITWQQQNESVYYDEIKTDISLPNASLTDLFRILQESFESF